MTSVILPDQLLRLGEAAEVLETKILSTIPEWDRFERSGIIPAGSAKLLSQLHGVDTAAVRIIISSSPDVVALIPLVLSNVASEATPAQYLLTLVSESCRADSSLWDLILKQVKQPTEWFSAVTLLLGRPNVDSYTADKAIQVLTAVMAHAPDTAFTVQQVKLLATNLVSGQYRTTQVGVLDGLSNLLKQDSFRKPLFEVFGTLEKILSVSVEAPPALYRSLFCLWVSSFNDSVLSTVLAAKGDSIVALLKSTFTECRVEKILRMALAVVMNLVACPAVAEAMVESGILHTIQPLEYEKWREAELYEAIRATSARVAAETTKHSNFERYERELKSGTLKWGFIHSEKFWLENFANFEQSDFAPVAKLIALLASSDPVTQAVACHDLGEFSRLHPSGKRVMAKLNAKSVVMNLMSSPQREVAKEALLCTQKLMLNQWQKLNQPTSSSAAPQVKAR